MLRRAVGLVAMLVVIALVGLAGASHARADSAGSIDHAEAKDGGLRLLFSLPGVAEGTGADLSSVQVTIGDTSVEATAAAANKAVRRTAILTIDVSNSMRGERFAQAKQAAKAFIAAAPADVLVGIVTFASDVRTVQEPTLDRGRLREDIDGLALSPQTRLYEGVIEAIEAVGKEGEGQRSLLVLSDGKDTSGTPVEDVTAAIRNAAVKVDIVALEPSADALDPLEQMAAVGKGQLLTADDPEELVRVFSDEAAYLAKQVLVSAVVPDDLSGTEGTVAVSIEAAGVAYTDTAFVTLKRAEATAPAPTGAQEIATPAFQVSSGLMLLGIVATGAGALVVLLLALGVFTTDKKESLEDRVAAYSRTGDPRAASGSGGARPTPGGPPKGVTGSAVDVAEKALAGSEGLEAAVASRLDAAGMSLKPAEWLLLHAGIALGSAVLAFLISSGSPLVTVVVLAAGVIVPWLFLGMKKARRLKAFNSHLAETLQLISGSLSAGLSLAQSIDTVVREGTEPIAGEFRRSLIEARLGVQLEDALDSIASRMESEDFNWVVMAIRIQREVGGNLAELLLSVAATMRERDYLRRQVKSLSAEGRLSAWILGGLPPFFIGYLTLVNPSYLKPLYSTQLGWVMLGAMGGLMVVGTFWMSRMVKVEV